MIDHTIRMDESEFKFIGFGKRIVPAISCSSDEHGSLFFNLDSGSDAWIAASSTVNVGEWE